MSYWRWLIPFYGVFTTLCLCLIGVEEDQSKPQINRGTLFLVGGGITSTEMRKQFVELAGGLNARIVIVPSATKTIATDEAFLANWTSFGAASLTVVNAKNREESNCLLFGDIVHSATGVWFGGGDQDRLVSIYQGTSFHKELLLLYNYRGGVVGGTSAGASCVSEVMIYGNTSEPGFGLTKEFIVDQHFTNRNRFERLNRLVEKEENRLGLGIDESTAAIIHDNDISVIGKGSVTVCGKGFRKKLYPESNHTSTLEFRKLLDCQVTNRIN